MTPLSQSPGVADLTPYTSKEPPARLPPLSPRPLTTCSSIDFPLSPGLSTRPITPIWPRTVSRKAIPVSPLVPRLRLASLPCGPTTAAFHRPHRHLSRVATPPASGGQLRRFNRDLR